MIFGIWGVEMGSVEERPCRIEFGGIKRELGNRAGNPNSRIVCEKVACETRALCSSCATYQLAGTCLRAYVRAWERKEAGSGDFISRQLSPCYAFLSGKSRKLVTGHEFFHRVSPMAGRRDFRAFMLDICARFKPLGSLASCDCICNWS